LEKSTICIRGRPLRLLGAHGGGSARRPHHAATRSGVAVGRRQGDVIGERYPGEPVLLTSGYSSVPAGGR
jgi:hypothetical protein